MNDELDPVLRRLFAETAERPADEAFVTAVTARTARARLRPSLGRAAAGALVLAAIVAALAVGLGLAATLLTRLLDASLVGQAAALALVLAGAVYARVLGPLIWRPRL